MTEWMKAGVNEWDVDILHGDDSKKKSKDFYTDFAMCSKYTYGVVVVKRKKVEIHVI